MVTEPQIKRIENGNYSVAGTRLLWLLCCTRRLLEMDPLLNDKKSAIAIDMKQKLGVLSEEIDQILAERV